ncbi:MAG: hypothetical protein KA190_26945 [Kofleriaceae bacterium]|nr:hypothetical protein [Kofleriaceae bacterium]
MTAPGTPRARAGLAAALLVMALAGPAGAEAPAPADAAPAAPTAPAARRADPTRVAAAPVAGPTTDAAVIEAEASSTAAPTTPWIRPFAAVVGGLEVETLDNRPGDQREDRLVTVALSRFGVRAGVAPGITVESEFEANAGPHGSSAWEGQAALSVRNQLVRVERGRLRVDAGRITDPASLDFVSDHVFDQLLTDGYTRGSLLASGFNRGNGVHGQFEVAPKIRLGLTLNAANPVSTTSSLVVGGTFPPFARFYFAPYQYVGRDAANFPADEYHFTMVTPSVMIDHDRVTLHAAIQLFQVNTDTTRSDDQHIDGYNARVSAATRLWQQRGRLFANASIVQNEVVDPDDGKRLSGDIYTGTSVGAGVDVAPWRWGGFGAQAAYLRDHQGARHLADQLFVNLGATYHLASATAIGARLALYRRCEAVEDPAATACVVDGERSFFLTLRTQI